MKITNGTVDQYIEFYAVDSVDFSTAETGKVNGDWTVSWTKNNSAAATATHTIAEVSLSLMPGWYRLKLDFGTTLSAGNNCECLSIHITASGVAPVPLQVLIERVHVTEGETIGVNASGHVSRVTLVDTTTTNTDMRGTDNAATAANLAIVAGYLDTEIASILQDTGTDIPAQIAALVIPTAAAIADAVWDESIISHLVSGTTGRYAFIASGLILDTTVTGAPTTTTLQLTAGSTTDNFYRDLQIVPLNGSLAGQARIVSSYVGATRTVTVDEPWTLALTAGDGVAMRSTHAHPLFQIADAVWDEVASGHVTTDTFGLLVNTIYNTLVNTRAEPGQGAPGATIALPVKLDYLYKWARNKVDSTGTTVNHYADDGTTVDQKRTTGESGGTVTKGEMASGP